MSRQKVQKVTQLLVQLGKYANFPLDDVDDDDTILLRDLALEYVKLVSQILASNCKTIDDKYCDDAKAAFHTITRMNLKYALRQIDKTWELYRRYDSNIKTFFDMGNHSDAHGAAGNILNSSRSRDKAAKIAHYDEFIVHIEKMNELAEKIRKTKIDCLAKIKEVGGSPHWLRRHEALIGVITLLISVLICTSANTIRHSIVGKFVSKSLSIIPGRWFLSSESCMSNNGVSEGAALEINSSNDEDATATGK